MKRILLFVMGVVMACSTGCAQEVSKAKNAFSDQIEDQEIAELIANSADLFPNNTQLSIAIIDGESSTYYGIKRTADELVPVHNEESIFEIGSISKVFTSILLSKQVNEGALSVDDLLTEFVDIDKDVASTESEEISLKMLANHTSGLPRIPQNMLAVMMLDQSNPYVAYTPELLKEFYRGAVKLDNTPGMTYAYSNLGTGTLGYILSQRKDMTYEALLQQDIFEPLNMVHSSSLLISVDSTKLVRGLNADGSVASNWDFTDAMVGAGGIKSNVVDMEKFVRKHFEEDEIYNLPLRSTHEVASSLEIGLGWHISIDGEKKFHWHNGGTGGYRSCMVLDKKSKKAVILLSNVSAFAGTSDRIDNLCFELMKTLQK